MQHAAGDPSAVERHPGDALTPAGGLALAVASFVARLPAAAAFLYTGYEKVKNPGAFAKEIRAYELAPLEVTNALALYLPWLEILTGGLVLVPLFRREARGMLILMLTVFTALKLYVQVMGLKITCGCVPTDSPLHFLFNGWTGVTTNAVMLGLLLVDAIRLDRERNRGAA